MLYLYILQEVASLVDTLSTSCIHILMIYQDPKKRVLYYVCNLKNCKHDFFFWSTKKNCVIEQHGYQQAYLKKQLEKPYVTTF